MKCATRWYFWPQWIIETRLYVLHVQAISCPRHITDDASLHHCRDTSSRCLVTTEQPTMQLPEWVNIMLHKPWNTSFQRQAYLCNQLDLYWQLNLQEPISNTYKNPNKTKLTLLRTRLAFNWSQATHVCSVHFVFRSCDLNIDLMTLTVTWWPWCYITTSAQRHLVQMFGYNWTNTDQRWSYKSEWRWCFNVSLTTKTHHFRDKSSCIINEICTDN